jgi:hypothetical protein
MFILNIQTMCVNYTNHFMAYGNLSDLGSQNFQQNSGLSSFMKVRLICLSLCFSHLTLLYRLSKKKNFVIYILIYVDDILITGSSASAIANIINSLLATFVVKD